MMPLRGASAETRGILYMIMAVATLASMDALAKLLSQHVDTLMVVWARYAGQTLLVMAVVAPRLRQVARTRYPGLQFLRSLLMLSATSFFFFGIARLGLAESTAIVDINPVLVTLGATLFLGERMGPRRALGVLAGLVGAVIIIRPGGEVFSAAALLPLGAALSFAGYALVTRFVGLDEDVWTSLLYSALFGTAVLSLGLPLFFSVPGPWAILGLTAMGALGTLGQMLLIRAYSAAEAGLVAPFSYAGILVATFWGVALFGDFPDFWTIAGMVVIVGSGIYVWHREMKVARRWAALKVRADAEATQH
jgi:drug/metabolite transporter (DMT)-like permease